MILINRFRKVIFGENVLKIVSLSVTAAYLSIFIYLYISGKWILNKHGDPLNVDFIWIWLGGKIALSGHALDAFSYPYFSKAQVPLVGPPQSYFDYFHWIYPPSLFFYLIPFALLPYSLAFPVWVVTTMALYACSIQAIVRRPWAWSCALMPLPVMFNIKLGHTGFLMAGLLGFSLFLMERSPFAGGLVLGLLTYKPQLGLLFPIVLLAAGQWRVLAGAVLSAGILGLAVAAEFGPDIWLKFLASVHSANPRTLMPDADMTATLQTVYGVLIWVGWRTSAAWGCHIVIALTVATLVCVIWRRPVRYAIKAAALAAGAMLVTPYMLFYDLTGASVAAAFIVRDGFAAGFLPGEDWVIFACFLALFFVGTPVGPFIAASLLALAVRRAFFQPQRQDSAAAVTVAVPGRQ